VGLFRRKETLNEKLLRDAGLDPASLLGDRADAALAPPPSTLATLGVPDGTGVGPSEWDACVTVAAAGLPGQRVGFTALPGGDLLVEEEEGAGDLTPLADALEQHVPPPYRAVAARQEGDLWAVGAKRIEVARIRFAGGDALELSRKDSWEELRVDGEPSDAHVPELRQLGERAGADFYVKAERLDGELWEVRVNPL
jgi:hypothetical protein